MFVFYVSDFLFVGKVEPYFLSDGEVVLYYILLYRVIGFLVYKNKKRMYRYTMVQSRCNSKYVKAIKSQIQSGGFRKSSGTKYFPPK